MRFRLYFAEINFRLSKILRKFYANVEEIFGVPQKNFTNFEEIGIFFTN